jgi:hypothetical protein
MSERVILPPPKMRRIAPEAVAAAIGGEVVAPAEEAAYRRRYGAVRVGAVRERLFERFIDPLKRKGHPNARIVRNERHRQERYAARDSPRELTPSQVRNLVMDEWDWTEHFAMTNSAYSDTAAAHYGRSDE